MKSRRKETFSLVLGAVGFLVMVGLLVWSLIDVWVEEVLYKLNW